jgi:hypothetical protein
MATTTIPVRALKVMIPVAAEALPKDLVPPDGPPGAPVLMLVLEGTAVKVRAQLNGKSVRKVLKQIAELGAEGVSVGVQGLLKPAAGGGAFELADAGIQVFVKTPKPAAPASNELPAAADPGHSPAASAGAPGLS